MKITKKEKILIWTLSIVLAVSLAFGACALYVSDYYRADRVAEFILQKTTKQW